MQIDFVARFVGYIKTDISKVMSTSRNNSRYEVH